MKFTHLVLLLLMLGAGVYASGQVKNNKRNRQNTNISEVRRTQKLNGIVTDALNVPVPGATVEIQETNISTITDARGNFSLTTGNNDILVFKKDGYLSKAMPVGNSDESISVSLLKEITDAGEDDDVVIPFGVRKKREITTSISSFRGEDLPRVFTSDFRNLLAGRVPGLLITQNATVPGSENVNMIIRSRSSYNDNNGPLVLIDGIERGIANIDREEVENITVLKDPASAVWYGLKAANGVIIVTTKKGSTTRSEINLDVQTSLLTPTHLSQPLNSYDFARLYNEAIVNDGGVAPYSADTLEKYRTNTNPYLFPDNNYLNSFIRDKMMAHRYIVSANGGNNIVQYFLTLGYINQQGLFTNTKNANYNSDNGFKKFLFRTNVDFTVNKNFQISLSTGGRTENRVNPGNGLNTVLNSIYNTPPNVFPILNENGSYGGSALYQKFVNPLAELQATGYQSQLSRILQTTLNARHKLDFITRGLGARILFSYDIYGFYSSGLRKDYAMYDFSGVSASNPNPVVMGTNTSLDYRAGSYDGNNRTNEIWAGFDYDRLFADKHRVRMILMGTRGINYAPNRLDYRSQSASYRVEYDYAQKYYFSFVSAYSGSENFAPKKRYGFFPGVSAAWVVSDEKFLKPNDIFTYFKIRASYAKSGNSDIGGSRFPFETYYSRTPNGGGYPFGDGPTATNSSWEVNLGNPDITWESLKGLNIGADLKFIKNKLSLIFDYYNYRRYNILTPASLPSILGQSIAAVNEGEVKSKGFEGQLYYNDNIGKLGINFNANLSKFDNKVIYQSGQSSLSDYQVTTGRPIGSLLAYLSDGLFATNDEVPAGLTQNGVRPIAGDIRYMDVNDDKIIDGLDRVRINMNPTGFYGFGSSLVYDFIDLSFQFQGTMGRRIFIQSYYNSGPYNLNSESLKRWTPETAASAEYPRLSISNINNGVVSDYWLKDGDYLRLKTIELGFTIPKNIIHWKFLQSARLYLGGFNLLTFDKLNLNMDPEITDAGNNAYPYLKTYTLGLNLKF